MTRVGWDLDGVHYLFAECVWETLVKQGRRKGPMPPVTHWHFYRDKAWGEMTDADFVQTCHDGADMGILFSHGGYDPDSIAEMNKLYLAGYPTVIVTDRSFGKTPRVSELITIQQLKVHRAFYDEIYFTADKPSIPLDYMIDDKLENYDALDAVGVKVYLLNRPWNYIEGGDDRRRLDTVREYTDIVLKETALTAGVY